MTIIIFLLQPLTPFNDNPGSATVDNNYSLLSDQERLTRQKPKTEKKGKLSLLLESLVMLQFSVTLQVFI